MSAPQTATGSAPDAYRPAFLGIGISLAGLAIFCIGYATYGAAGWDAAVATATTTVDASTVLAGK